MRLVQQMTSRVQLYSRKPTRFYAQTNCWRIQKLVLQSRNKLMLCESNSDVREDLDKSRKQAIPKLATWEANSRRYKQIKSQITLFEVENVVALSIAWFNLPIQVIFGLDIHAMFKFQNLPTYPLPCEVERVSSVRRFPGVCEWV